MCPALSRCRSAFTRVELLLVVGLGLLVLGLTLSALFLFRFHSITAETEKRLAQLTPATIDTANAHNGKMPTGDEGIYPDKKLDAGNGYGPCLFHILPNLDNEPLYKSTAIKTETHFLHVNWKVKGTPVDHYFSAGDPTASQLADRTSFLANQMAFSMPDVFSLRFPASFNDGSARMIMFIEGYSVAYHSLAVDGRTTTWKVERRWWENPMWDPYSRQGGPFQLAPRMHEANACLPQSHSPEFILAGMVDRSVRHISASISDQAFRNLCFVQDEGLGPDW